MFIASWIIMITKILTMRRVKKDNLAFLADFRRVGTSNLASLDADEDPAAEEHNVLQALSGSHDHYQSSTDLSPLSRRASSRCSCASPTAPARPARRA